MKSAGFCWDHNIKILVESCVTRATVSVHCFRCDRNIVVYKIPVGVGNEWHHNLIICFDVAAAMDSLGLLMPLVLILSLTILLLQGLLLHAYRDGFCTDMEQLAGLGCPAADDWCEVPWAENVVHFGASSSVFS